MIRTESETAGTQTLDVTYIFNLFQIIMFSFMFKFVFYITWYISHCSYKLRNTLFRMWFALWFRYKTSHLALLVHFLMVLSGPECAFCYSSVQIWSTDLGWAFYQGQWRYNCLLLDMDIVTAQWGYDHLAWVEDFIMVHAKYPIRTWAIFSSSVLKQNQAIMIAASLSLCKSFVAHYI